MKVKALSPILPINGLTNSAPHLKPANNRRITALHRDISICPSPILPHAPLRLHTPRALQPSSLDRAHRPLRLFQTGLLLRRYLASTQELLLLPRQLPNATRARTRGLSHLPPFHPLHPPFPPRRLAFPLLLPTLRSAASHHGPHVLRFRNPRRVDNGNRHRDLSYQCGIVADNGRDGGDGDRVCSRFV